MYLKVGNHFARAEYMSSAQDVAEVQQLMQELRGYCYGSTIDANRMVKLLYVTPEKFSKSESLKSLLRQLSQKGLLSRFVLDEAHCLSQVCSRYHLTILFNYLSNSAVGPRF